MRPKLITQIHFVFKIVWITCAFLLVAHVLFIFFASINFNLPKFTAINFVEYPKKLLLSNSNYYIDLKNSKRIETYPFNYKISEKNNPSKELKVEAVNATLYINVSNEKPILLMILLKRILYLFFFLLISYCLSKIFGCFSKEKSFVKESAKQVNIIAFTFILFSPTMLLFNIIFQLSLTGYEMFGGSEMTIYDWNLQYVLFGILILAIKEMFQHGVMLQKEYDQTI